MIFGLETYDADDLRTRIAFAQLTCGNAILGEVGSIGCRAISFRIVAKIFDLNLRPLLHLAIMGHILAAPIFQ